MSYSIGLSETLESLCTAVSPLQQGRAQSPLIYALSQMLHIRRTLRTATACAECCSAEVEAFPPKFLQDEIHLSTSSNGLASRRGASRAVFSQQNCCQVAMQQTRASCCHT
eukprot:334638-Lingulodinium_polyedra.AAC.1